MTIYYRTEICLCLREQGFLEELRNKYKSLWNQSSTPQTIHLEIMSIGLASLELKLFLDNVLNKLKLTPSEH